MTNLYKIAVVVLLVATLGLQIVMYTNSHKAPSPAKSNVQDAPPNTTFTIATLPALGRVDTKVVMIEFSDFECPYCARYATQTFPEVEKKWISTGNVEYVFSNNPLPIHKNAKMLAKAGVCAEDKFWTLHDLMFTVKPTTPDAVLTVVDTIPGLNTDKFSACFSTEGGYPDSVVTKDLAAGKLMNIQGTPSFAIGVRNNNGTVSVKKMVKGAQPIGTINAAIEAVIAGK